MKFTFGMENLNTFESNVALWCSVEVRSSFIAPYKKSSGRVIFWRLLKPNQS